MAKALRGVTFFKKWIALVELLLYLTVFFTLLAGAYRQFIAGG
jgi:hypothetical protein